jgi:hypothetical protein
MLPWLTLADDVNVANVPNAATVPVVPTMAIVSRTRRRSVASGPPRNLRMNPLIGAQGADLRCFARRV